MNARGAVASLIIASGMCAGMSNESRAQCGLSEFFSGCFSCCRKAPARGDQGRFRAVVDRTLPLAEVGEAHRLLEAREAYGKIALLI